MVAYTKHDLQFILGGIEVSETHAEMTNTIHVDMNGNRVWTVADLETSRQTLVDLVPNSLEPIGLRTITGELNNLVIGQGEFGATGQFPRLTDPDYRDDGLTGNPDDADGLAFGPPGSGAPVLDNTDYSQSDGPGFNGPPGPFSNGDVVDSDPRIISNLIADQSVNNPAAIAAAGADAGADGIFGTADDTFNDGVTLINPEVTVRVQAEDLTLESGFFIEAQGAADEGEVIRTVGHTLDAVASLTVGSGAGSEVVAGQNDIAITFFDESDGVSTLQLQVNGVDVGAPIVFDQDGGGNAAQAENLRTVTISDIDLVDGDVVTIVGDANAGELLRIDHLEFTAVNGIAGDGDEFFEIPNTAPDEGLSAQFNTWFVLFGQFFDHGLTQTKTGDSGTVYIPLQPDDPLYVEGSPTNFMVINRASVDPGADGVLGTDDDGPSVQNLTSPFVDQNQTYTSTPSAHI